MGCCASSQDGLQEAKDGAPRLILVAAGSADALSFDYANVLREGYEAPLTANGKHVGLYWAKPRNAWGHWDYIDLGVSEKLCPLRVKFDGPSHLGRVFIVWNGPHGEFAFADAVTHVKTASDAMRANAAFNASGFQRRVYDGLADAPSTPVPDTRAAQLAHAARTRSLAAGMCWDPHAHLTHLLSRRLHSVACVECSRRESQCVGCACGSQQRFSFRL